MEVLRIIANQVFANYRKPMSYSFIDTYPLPPLSTVKGWFHNVIEATEYIPVSMSIQGKSDFIVYDMQTLIKFDRKRGDKDQIIIEGFNKAFSKSPTYVANLYNTYLIIYLASERKYLEKFKENVFNKVFPSLGRYEDLINIDSIDFVEIVDKKFPKTKPFNLRHGIYLNRDKNKSIIGINYKQSFRYDPMDGLRIFTDKRDVVYVDDYNFSGNYLFDEKQNTIVDFIGDYVQ